MTDHQEEEFPDRTTASEELDRYYRENDKGHGGPHTWDDEDEWHEAAVAEHRKGDARG
jgi:hypothetical protein